jgi:hypothetical protein
LGEFIFLLPGNATWREISALLTWIKTTIEEIYDIHEFWISREVFGSTRHLDSLIQLGILRKNSEIEQFAAARTR